MSVNDPSGPRKRIVEAIRQSGLPCWLTFKEGTFGLAGFIEFQTDKAYLEVLFFPKQHPKHPITISISSKVLPVKEIIVDIQQNLKYSESGEYADPAVILDRIDRFRLAYIDSAKGLLNKEKDLIESAYEVAGSPGEYRQDILLHLQETVYVVSVDYRRYPVVPRVDIPATLLQRAGLKATSDLSTLKTWEPTGRFHVLDILDEICTLAWKGDGKIAKEYQVFDVSGVEMPGLLKGLDFQLPRGRVAGMIVEGASTSELISRLASMPGGEQKQLAGEMRVFGKPAFPDDVCIVNATPPPNCTGKKVSQIIASTLAPQGQGMVARKTSMRALIDASGLGLVIKDRVENLTRMDVVKLNIARNVLLGRKVFFLDFNAIGINRLEYIPYQKLMRAVARAFHVIFIISGPGALVSIADQIVTITPDREATNASLEAYQAQVAGDVITVHVTGVPEGFIEKLKNTCKSPVVEEIRSERYKIYSTGDAKALMVRIYAECGQNIYKISISPPKLEDYLQFTQLAR
nr:hypothetical protein [Candidatus Sigynarchaeum springense]